MPAKAKTQARTIDEYLAALPDDKRAATGNHCAFYLMSSSTLAAFKDELGSYDTSKGTIRFQADKPLPAALVRKLVKARLAENASHRKGSR